MPGPLRKIFLPEAMTGELQKHVTKEQAVHDSCEKSLPVMSLVYLETLVSTQILSSTLMV